MALSHPLAGKQQLKVLNLSEFWGFQNYINTVFLRNESSEIAESFIQCCVNKMAAICV
jgi:hypothetical protein